MTEPAIRARGLGKKYQLGGAQASVRDLRDALRRVATAPLRWAGHREAGSREKRQEFWALRGVDFEVAPGETVGVVGRNGAGKSTLLKILSRITEPTEGNAEVRGRVSSLLEVGTGFHPELTGRENVYLNGAILGMRRTEIARKFDQIVAFAEIGPFIDTPVKHFSSGMKVRLAFSVAAHLEPEVLIIDEVLAVGDTAFQAKCLGKMGEVSGAGRTVLFVSHNMSAVEHLCQRALWLEHGRVVADGGSGEVVQRYLESFRRRPGETVVESPDGSLRITAVRLAGGGDGATAAFPPESPLRIEVDYQASGPIDRPRFWLGVYGRGGPLFGASMLLDGCHPPSLTGSGTLACSFERLPLLPRQGYWIKLGARGAEGRTVLLPTTDVGYFVITGSAETMGFGGELADSLLSTAAPVVVPYRWELPKAPGAEAAVDAPLGALKEGALRGR